MKVFLDTNVLLDTIVERSNSQFTEDAATILELGECGVVDLYMSILSIPTIAYVLKNIAPSRKKRIINDLTSIVKVLPSLPEHVSQMLDSQATDIEDALQALSANEGQCDLIVTRNITDFKESDIPAISWTRSWGKMIKTYISKDDIEQITRAIIMKG